MSDHRVKFERYGFEVPCTACNTGLCYVNVNDKKKTRGQISLFCPACALKHFPNVEELEAWATESAKERKRAKREANR